VRKLVGKRPLGRPRHRLEDSITTDLRGVGWGDMDCIELAQDRDRGTGTCESGSEPSGSIKCEAFRDYLRTG